MIRLSITTPAAILAAAAATTAANASILVGVADFAPFGGQGLYSFDTTTGAATLIGDTGITGISGIAWDDANQTLYAQDFAGALFTVNPFTAQSTFIGSAATFLPEGGLTFDNAGQLWAVNGPFLGTIDTDTGAYSPLSIIQSATTDISGIAFDDTNATIAAYAKNGNANDSILAINPLTGETTETQLPFGSTSPLGGLDFNPDTNQLFLADGDDLAIINDNAVVIPLGESFVTNISGIAFIPTPGAIAIFATASAFAARRRRA